MGNVATPEAILLRALTPLTCEFLRVYAQKSKKVKMPPGKGVKGQPFPNPGKAPKRHGLFVKTSLFGRISKLGKGRAPKKKVVNTVQAAGGILTGRRIIEPNYLASQLFCKHCKANLLLTDIKEETQHGLASTLGIECRECNLRNYVYTCKRAPLHTGKNIFEINIKIAMGTYIKTSIMLVFLINN